MYILFCKLFGLFETVMFLYSFYTGAPDRDLIFWAFNTMLTVYFILDAKD